MKAIDGIGGGRHAAAKLEVLAHIRGRRRVASF
jgi:hypothetical protein